VGVVLSSLQRSPARHAAQYQQPGPGIGDRREAPQRAVYGPPLPMTRRWNSQRPPLRTSWSS
jgi:hypothetical protein